MSGQATTGLTSEQFDELVDRVGERIVWDYGRGRPRELTLHQAVKAVVMYFRTNITQKLITELLLVDQSTISRAISDLEEIIAEALDEFAPELPEELSLSPLVTVAIAPAMSTFRLSQSRNSKNRAAFCSTPADSVNRNGILTRTARFHSFAQAVSASYQFVGIRCWAPGYAFTTRTGQQIDHPLVE